MMDEWENRLKSKKKNKHFQMMIKVLVVDEC